MCCASSGGTRNVERQRQHEYPVEGSALKRFRASRRVWSEAVGACSDDDGTEFVRRLQPQPAKIGAWGFDLEGMDRAADPGGSFYAHANGTWMATSEIPADRVAWGSFNELAASTEEQLRGLVAGLPPASEAGTPAQKVNDYYRSYLDTEAIEVAGIGPAQAGLDAIAAAQTHEDVVTLMARPELGLLSPIEVNVSIDEKNPDRYVVGIEQSGLSLPDREYYLDPIPQYQELLTAYQAHVSRMLALIAEPDAEAKAATILALETAIAELHWPIEMRRDRELTYNLPCISRLRTVCKSGDAESCQRILATRLSGARARQGFGNST